MKKYYILITSIAMVLYISCKNTKNNSAPNAVDDSTISSTTPTEDTSTSNQKFSQEPRIDADSTMREKVGSTGAADNLLVSPSNENDESNGAGHRNPEKIVTETSGSTGGAENILPATPDGNTGSTLNFEKLSSYLEMTNEQVRKFKTAMENFGKSEGRASGGERDLSIKEEQRKQLKSILSKDQFKKYQKWITENQ